MAIKTYHINEVFRSHQGEGMRAGTDNVFVRFAGCNMQCAMAPGPKSPGGFDCDTEFAGSMPMTVDQLCSLIDEVYSTTNLSPLPDGFTVRVPNEPGTKWIVFTGGEPCLQLDALLCDTLKERGWSLAIETNGSLCVPAREPFPAKLADYRLDWITVSPKVAEHCVRQHHAHEVKYVRGFGQALPRPRCEATYKLLSPAFLHGMNLPDPKAVEWVTDLVLKNTDWRVSTQMHKAWKVR